MTDVFINRRCFVAGSVALSWLAVSGRAHADDAVARGLDVARRAEQYANGFGDYVADMKMTLRNRQGQESVRNMRTRTLETAGDGDKSLVIFDQPADIRGTALLTFTRRQGDDNQWLYLPALRRVKRIASNNKSGPFVGSEFAYEDVASQEVEKFGHRWLREESWEGQLCDVLEQTPLDPNSGYKRKLVWIDRAELRALKVEFFDRKDSHVKTLSSTYAHHLKHQWRPISMAMLNHQSGKSTSIEFSNYKFAVGLGERDFDQDSLERVR